MNLIIHVNFFKNVKKMRLTLIFGETMFHLGTNYVYCIAPDIDNNAAPMRTLDACASFRTYQIATPSDNKGVIYIHHIYMLIKC